MDPLRGLARDAAAGDVEATNRLVDAVAAPVLRVVRVVFGRRGADAEDPEDIAQESLMAFVRALGDFRGECTVLHYACRIAVRAATAACRRARERGTRLDARLPDLGGPGGADDPPAAVHRRELVRWLLAELPEVQAETLAFRVILGASLQDIAQSTRVPVNTVRSRLRLAKQAVRRRLAEDPELLEILEVAG